MADVLKYGWVRGGRMGTEMKLDASMTFAREGGAFVCASSTTGLMQVVTASTQAIVGWAEVPRAAVPGVVDYWTSSTTAGQDKVLVIHDPTAVFALPVDETVASLTASLVGLMVCASAPQGRASTSLVQVSKAAQVGGAANGQLFVTGVDTTEKIVYVRINPHGLA